MTQPNSRLDSRLDSSGRPSEEVLFTRYLYNAPQVGASLRAALLEKNRDKALFWTYELYFSGLTDLSWAAVESAYALNWESSNPKLKKHLISKRKCESDTGIGSIVLTLCMRQSNQPNVVNDEKFLFSLSETALAPYRTRLFADSDTAAIRPRDYLKTVSKYAVICDLNHKEKDLELNAAFLGDWLYYCAATPCWMKIFETYGMTADVLNKKMVFPDDDVMESFFETYGYEPDEQSIALEKMHGIIL